MFASRLLFFLGVLVVGGLLLGVMEKRVEQCTIIKFLVKSGHTLIQCWRQLRQAFQGDTVSKNCVRVWHKKFLQGEESTQDKKRSGWPRSAHTPEAADHVTQALQQY